MTSVTLGAIVINKAKFFKPNFDKILLERLSFLDICLLKMSIMLFNGRPLLPGIETICYNPKIK